MSTASTILEEGTRRDEGRINEVRGSAALVGIGCDTTGMRFAKWVLLPMVGALAVYALTPPRAPTYRDVVVTRTQIEEREPDTVRTFVDRIVTVEVPARQIATAPLGAQDDVARFCAPTVVTLTDTVVVMSDPAYLIRSITHEPGWFWQRDKLLLTGPTSFGDLVAMDYDVRPGYTARAVGPDVLVQYPRTALIRELIEPALAVLAGYGLAQVF